MHDQEIIEESNKDGTNLRRHLESGENSNVMNLLLKCTFLTAIY